MSHSHKTLFVLSHNPSRASFRQRIGDYLNILEAAGIHCRIERFPESPSERWGLFKESNDYDAVLLHKKTLNIWDARILRRHAKKIVFDFDDAVMYSPNQPNRNFSSHMRLFKRTVGLADRIIAGNEYLARHARQHCSDVHVLPTGLDTKIYDTIPESSKDGVVRLVWIGSKSTLKYLEEIRPALEQIGIQCKNVILRLICDAFLEFDKIQVEKCQWSLGSQVQDLKGSDIGLAPLPENRFTQGKCGFKILQYAAAGLPSVVSPVGINQEIIRNGWNGYLAKTEEEWIDKLGGLIKSQDLREHMSMHAKEMSYEYDQKKIGGRFRDLIMALLK